MNVVSYKSVEHYIPSSGTPVNLWSLVRSREEFFADARGLCLRMLQAGIEGCLEEARDEAVGACRHERSEGRREYRNGYYVRKGFKTALGRIERLRIPRCRKSAWMKEVRALMARSEAALGNHVVAMFLAGCSTRAIGPLLDGVVGTSVSAGQVSRLTRRLDQAVGKFHRRPLQDKYVYLVLDGVYLKRRSSPRLFQNMATARRKVALVAYGVTHRGEKELIAFQLEPSESGAAWRRFLSRLVRQGLHGDRLRLVITDGAKGVLSALEDVFPQAKTQRCWFHKMSNVLAKVRKKHVAACLRGLRKVYTASHRRAAEAAYAAWARAWAHTEPKAVACVEADLEALLAFYAFPEPHRRMIRTTNAIERCFREVRRRTRPIGCFMNEASIERIIYALFSAMNAKWAGKPCKAFKETLAAA